MLIKTRNMVAFVLVSILLVSCLNRDTSSDNALTNDIKELESESQPIDDLAENKHTDVDSTSNSISATITFEEIKNILVTENKLVIESLGISDTNKEYSIGTERYYVPLFSCKHAPIYICFDGSQHDKINDILSRANETPYTVIPFDGTTIVFDDEYSFCIGDDIKSFTDHYGEGALDEYSNLKGNRQTYHMIIPIDIFEVHFASYDKAFSEYFVSFSKKSGYEEYLKSPLNTWMNLKIKYPKRLQQPN